MNNTPCKNCSERKIGCHARCKLYLAWKTDHDKIRVKLQQEKVINYNPNFIKKVRLNEYDLSKL